MRTRNTTRFNLLNRQSPHARDNRRWSKAVRPWLAGRRRRDRPCAALRGRERTYRVRGSQGGSVRGCNGRAGAVGDLACPGLDAAHLLPVSSVGLAAVGVGGHLRGGGDVAKMKNVGRRIAAIYSLRTWTTSLSTYRFNSVNNESCEPCIVSGVVGELSKRPKHQSRTKVETTRVPSADSLHGHGSLLP